MPKIIKGVELATTDSRGRVSIKQHVGADTPVMIEKLPGGAVVITPISAVVTPAEEILRLENPVVASMLASEDDDVEYVEIDLETGRVQET